MNKAQHIPFSVCMAVYKNDNADDFLTALRSVTLQQSVQPTELILVVDGPIPESVEQSIRTFAGEYKDLRVIRFEQNQGHAAARQAGIDAIQTAYFAIMDSDDIALPNRFEKQIAFLCENPDIDALGGQIEEFIHTPDNIVSKRQVPLTDQNIKTYMRARCPMNFQTVIVRKSSAQQAGGIQDWYCEEDYYLWIRMMLAQCRFANLPDTLAYVRVGKDMYARRGGVRYFKSERGIQRFMLKKNIISLPRYCYNVLGRLTIQVLMPNWLRGLLFQKLFRK